MSASKLGRSLSLAWFFLVRALVGVIVGVGEENGGASAEWATVESAPRGVTGHGRLWSNGRRSVSGLLGAEARPEG